MGRINQKEPDRPSIVVLYTSLMILLLAFFILLNAFSTTEETKLRKAVKSVGEAFGAGKGNISPLDLGFNRSGSTFSSPINPVEQDYVAIRGVTSDKDLKDQVKLLRSNSVRTLVMLDSLLFEPNSTELGEHGKEFLSKIAGIIQGRSYPISLRGHTDSTQGIEKDGRDNWKISAQRALSVLRFLVSRGVNANRLAAFGLAGFKPMVPLSNPQHTRYNNRVELVFDVRDSAFYDLPTDEAQRKLDFKGFTFDLFKDKKEK